VAKDKDKEEAKKEAEAAAKAFDYKAFAKMAKDAAREEARK